MTFVRLERPKNTDPRTKLCGKISYCSWPPKARHFRDLSRKLPRHGNSDHLISFKERDCLSMGEENVPDNAPIQKHFRTPLNLKELLVCSILDFCTGKAENDTCAGWKTYHTKGCPKPFLGGVSFVRFSTPLFFPTPPWRPLNLYRSCAGTEIISEAPFFWFFLISEAGAKKRPERRSPGPPWFKRDLRWVLRFLNRGSQFRAIRISHDSNRKAKNRSSRC